MRLACILLLVTTNVFALDLKPTKATVFVASYYQDYNNKLENSTPGLGLSWGADHGAIVGFYRNSYRTNTYYAGYAKSWQPARYLIAGVSAGIYRNESREGLHGFLVPYVGVPIGRFVPKLSYAKKNLYALHRRYYFIRRLFILKKFIEPLIGSLGIWLGGIVTLPLTGAIAGANVSYYQALKMGGILFLLRLIWLALLRMWFSKK